MNALDLLYIPVALIAPLSLRKRRSGWDQRFGHVADMFDAQLLDPSRKRLMLHAVSVGEVNALRAIVPMLAESCEVFVSTTTDTGLARAQSLFSDIEHAHVVRYPFDCSWMVDRFLDQVEPDAVGLVELEVWPNFIKRCTKRGIPVGIINGRLSERSFKGYRKIRPLLRPTFARLSFACVQDEHYAHRIGAMGVAEDRIEITGTMKWDSISTEPMSEPSQRAQEIANAMGVDLSKPIVVAGSSGPTEEPLFHTSVPEDVQLIIAPRKTERFDEAAKSVLGSVRRSKGEQRQGATRFLLDTIGELSSVYELADIVIMGRSFNDQFGSDPIEPAALGKPVILGPQHSDFMAAVDLLKADNAIRIETRESLADAVQSLLDDPDERAHMGESARTCVRSQQGASGKHTQRLLGLVKDP